MKIICAWCKKDMGETPEGGPDTVTHGICESCYEDAEEDLEEFLKERREGKNKPENHEFKIR